MSPTPTRAAAEARLETFLPRAGRDYRNQRNFDRGPGRHENVSGLSPWLRYRILSELELLEAVLSRHSRSAADKFVQEVMWRTYWKGHLQTRPALWHAYQATLRDSLSELATDDDLGIRYQAATTGATGIEAFDAWAAELTGTGYLHNHARMWFASIWTHTLRLPWALGADFFLRHLLDGDPASNTLSWRWVVGLQTRGKVYLATPENIDRYTEGRFPRPRGLAPEAEPLIEAEPAESGPWQPPPTPFSPRGRVGVLLLDDDLSPIELDMPVTGAAGLLTGRHRSPLATASLVLDFARDAVSVALAAIGRDGIGSEDAPIFDHVEDVVAWARKHSLDTLVCRQPTVGPAEDQASRLAGALQAHGIGWETALSDYDRLCWPHTGRGFFALKKRLPQLLDALDLPDI